MIAATRRPDLRARDLRLRLGPAELPRGSEIVVDDLADRFAAASRAAEETVAAVISALEVRR